MGKSQHQKHKNIPEKSALCPGCGQGSQDSHPDDQSSELEDRENMMSLYQVYI